MTTVQDNTVKNPPTETKKDPELIAMNVDLSNVPKVLLLGSTGDGKSTFVNYLVNYFKKGTLENMKVAIPSRNFPSPTEGYLHSESNTHDPSQSQTNECYQYLLFDEATQKRYIFIDTPGLGDTRDSNQDDINIKKIRKAVLNLGSLTVVMIIMNGALVCRNKSMIIVLNLLARILPDAVMKSVILVLTNKTSYARGFDLNRLPLPGSNVYVFTMQNSAYSRPINERSEDHMPHLKREWDTSMETIKDILARIDQFTDIAVAGIREMTEMNDQVSFKLHEIILQMISLHNMQEKLEQYKSKRDDYAKDQESFSNFVKTETLKRKRLVSCSNLNTLCLSCNMVCHENCKLDEITCAGDQLFMHCITMQKYGYKCSVCPEECLYTKHYHAKYTIVEKEETQETILSDIKAQHDQDASNLTNVEEEIKTIESMEKSLNSSIENQFSELKYVCEELNKICKGYDVAGKLTDLIDLMERELDSLSSHDKKSELEKRIYDMCSFCDKLKDLQDHDKDHTKLKILYQGGEIKANSVCELNSAMSDKRADHLNGIQQVFLSSKSTTATASTALTTSTASTTSMASTALTALTALTASTASSNKMSEPSQTSSPTVTDTSTYRDTNDSYSDDSTRSEVSIQEYDGETDSITIYNLPLGITKSRIEELLSRCGPLRYYRKPNGSTEPSIYIHYEKNFAKVTFEDPDSADDAVRRFDRMLIVIPLVFCSKSLNILLALEKWFGTRRSGVVTVVCSEPSWERKRL